MPGCQMKIELVSPTAVTVAKASVKLSAPIVPLPVVVKRYVTVPALAATENASEIAIAHKKAESFIRRRTFIARVAPPFPK